MLPRLSENQIMFLNQIYQDQTCQGQQNVQNFLKTVKSSILVLDSYHEFSQLWKLKKEACLKEQQRCKLKSELSQ